MSPFPEIFATTSKLFLSLRFQLLSQELGTFEAICVPCFASKLHFFWGPKFLPIDCFVRRENYLCFTSMKEEKWRPKLISLWSDQEVVCNSFPKLGFFRIGNFLVLQGPILYWTTTIGGRVVSPHMHSKGQLKEKIDDKEERHRFIVTLKVVFSEGMRGSFWLDFTSVSTESDLYSHRLQCYLLPFWYQFGSFLLVLLPHISRKDSTAQGIQEIDIIAWAWCIFQRAKV